MPVRTKRGATTSMLLLGLTMVILLLGGLAIDVAHGFCVKRQLQAAADAGAMAGAYCLTYPFPNPAMYKQADNYAREIVGRNDSDGVNLIHDDENVNVVVNFDVVKLRYPYKCNVSVSKKMSTILGRLVGVPSLGIEADATAGAFLGLRHIYSGQLLPMGISARAPIGQGVLNLDPQAKGKQNAQWISDWHGQNSPDLDVGSSTVKTSPSPGDNMPFFTPGSVVSVAMVGSGDPSDKTSSEKALPPANQVIGALSIKVNKILSPTQIDATIISGPILSGKSGQPILPSASQTDNAYAVMNPPWRIMLLE